MVSGLSILIDFLPEPAVKTLLFELNCLPGEIGVEKESLIGTKNGGRSVFELARCKIAFDMGSFDVIFTIL